MGFIFFPSQHGTETSDAGKNRKPRTNPKGKNQKNKIVNAFLSFLPASLVSVPCCDGKEKKMEHFLEQFKAL